MTLLATRTASAVVGVAALFPLLSLSACTTPTRSFAPIASVSNALVSYTAAPVEPLSATILRATRPFTDARSLDAATSCVVSAGPSAAIRFEADRFLIRIAQSDLCGTQFANREAWIAASDVNIADSAYAPSLVRVHETAGLRIAMAYHGDNIFCDTAARCRILERLYATPRCFANPSVAVVLQRAAQALHARDTSLTLKVLDCYRPIYAQERMFALVADPKWVAQPKPPRYGGHNRAVAIDLTVERNGVELDMGTAFDAFDDKSEWREDGLGITELQQSNRRVLRALMIESGFRPYDGEWWHFSLPFTVETEPKARNAPL